MAVAGERIVRDPNGGIILSLGFRGGEVYAHILATTLESGVADRFNRRKATESLLGKIYATPPDYCGLRASLMITVTEQEVLNVAIKDYFEDYDWAPQDFRRTGVEKPIVWGD